MAMTNYKVTLEDGSESWIQADESDPVGKAIVDQYETAAKNDDSPVKSIAKGNPPAANAAGAKGGS